MRSSNNDDEAELGGGEEDGFVELEVEAGWEDAAKALVLVDR